MSKSYQSIQVGCQTCGAQPGSPCEIREGDELQDGFHVGRAIVAFMGDTWRFDQK